MTSRYTQDRGSHENRARMERRFAFPKAEQRSVFGNLQENPAMIQGICPGLPIIDRQSLQPYSRVA